MNKFLLYYLHAVLFTSIWFLVSLFWILSVGLMNGLSSNSATLNEILETVDIFYYFGITFLLTLVIYTGSIKSKKLEVVFENEN